MTPIKLPPQSRVLVTGGLGFIGSHVIRQLLKMDPSIEIMNIDSETYAGLPMTLAQENQRNKSRFRSVPFSVYNERDVPQIFKEFHPNYVIHLAAESHVDNSIHGNSRQFWDTNATGTDVIAKHFCLQWQKDPDQTRRMIYVSTDEVYGSLALDDDRQFVETDPLTPSSPYAASKAAGELAVMSRRRTHAVDGVEPPIVITRCCNNYGPYQFPEKLIPTVILAASRNETIPIYGDGQNTREWIWVEDHVNALLAILSHYEGHGQLLSAIYNIGTGNEVRNLSLAQITLKIMDKPESLLQFVTDRPGHDRHYAVDSSKLFRETGWQPRNRSVLALMSSIVQWYLDPANADWIKAAEKRKPLIAR